MQGDEAIRSDAMSKRLLWIAIGCIVPLAYCSPLPEGGLDWVDWYAFAQTPGVNEPVPFTEADRAALPKKMQTLVPLHEPMKSPAPGEWLQGHPERPETYRQFVAAGPIKATKERRTIWIQPIGEFTAEQRKIVELSSEFLGHYFQLPVRIAKDWPLSVIPEKARRDNPLQGHPQIQSIYILHDLLKPALPEDAAALIAFTATDLWPGEGWNFVFGQASLQDRVGVWSMKRFGDAAKSDKEFRQVLRRTLKTAAHETGHMFSLPHCVYFDCCMNGSNSLPEADRQPLSLCPQCLAKLCYATGADPKKRFESLIGFAKANRLVEEQRLWERSLEAIGTK
jgi:archaemetzincin